MGVAKTDPASRAETAATGLPLAGNELCRAIRDRAVSMVEQSQQAAVRSATQAAILARGAGASIQRTASDVGRFHAEIGIPMG